MRCVTNLSLAACRASCRAGCRGQESLPQGALLGDIPADVIDRNGIRGERETLDTLLDFVAPVGSLINLTKLESIQVRARTSVGHSTIDAYLGYFEALLERVRRFDVKAVRTSRRPRGTTSDPGLVTPG